MHLTLKETHVDSVRHMCEDYIRGWCENLRLYTHSVTILLVEMPIRKFSPTLI